MYPVCVPDDARFEPFAPRTRPTMKLHPDQPQATYHVTAHGPGFVDIAQVRHHSGVCVVADAPPRPWAVDGFDALCEADFAQLADLGVELVLIGTGLRQRFPRAALLRALIARGIGFEIMNTAAACRTYNVLIGEGRRSAAALLVDTVPDDL